MPFVRKRKAELERTEFEIEHDYAKHPSLEPKEAKDFKRERKDILFSEIEDSSQDSGSDAELDIESTKPPPKMNYHRQKIEAQFKETEKLILTKVFGIFDSDHRVELDAKFNEEYKPVKARLQAGTASSKVVILNEVVECMLNLYASCLAVKGTDLEALKRRIFIDKASQVLRLRFSEIGHESKVLHWLHIKIVDMLPPYLLALYIDTLSSLRSKIPELLKHSLEPIIQQGTTKAAIALGLTTRKPWDPLTASPMNVLKQKLVPNSANAPLIIRIPSRPNIQNRNGFKNIQIFMFLLIYPNLKATLVPLLPKCVVFEPGTLN
jgi:hypothetical protein